MAHFYLSAAHKSSGKTTVSVGLAAALTRRGKTVQTFKKGPDYIDPLWLQRATGRPCYNLDFNTMTVDEIDALSACAMESADLALIEGNKGLYDGVALDGHDCNAAMAVALKAPVILVIDVDGITRGIAPLIMGYRAFGPEVHIAGVILNKVVSARQENKLREALERYTDVPVMGAVPRRKSLLAPERHLGLVPPDETDEVYQRINELAMLMEKTVEIDALLDIARMAPPPPGVQADTSARPERDIRIGIARDSAFGFYYADDLQALEQAGADLVFFSPQKDPHLPDVDGLFIGGGFPETHLQALEANKSLRDEIRRKARQGLSIYAECGGLMYLANSITWRDQSAEMVGVINGNVTMHDKPRGRGLVRLRETGHGLWPSSREGSKATDIHAHEFHYAQLDGLPNDTRYAFEVTRGFGIDGVHDGVVVDNVLAGFSHHRTTRQNDWAVRFARFVRGCK